MKNRYDLLAYKRAGQIEQRNWLGNLRWFAEEEKPFTYVFTAIPSRREEGQYIKPNEYDMKRILCKLKLNAAGFSNVIYGADYIKNESARELTALYFPWTMYGAVFEAALTPGSSIELFASDQSGRVTAVKESVKWEEIQNGFIIDDNDYYVCILHNAAAQNRDGAVKISGETIKLVLTFHKDKEIAEQTAQMLFNDTQRVLDESRAHWETYLDSCPVIELDAPYDYTSAFNKRKETYTPEQVLTRQLWQWWGVLVNVNQLAFNRMKTYIAPDKPEWKGVWSNDGPESLCALSLTNQAELAKECLVEYIAHSVSADGVNSWYLHADGTGCYQNPGDSGYFSHGVPNFIHTVEFYIRYTKDASILDCAAGDGLTIWDKIRKYLHRVYADRDINGDGLIEWVNLWESGWDDKISPFFSKKPIGEWIKAVTTLNSDQIKEFYNENSNPMTTLVDQVYMLWALKSAANMAMLKNEPELAGDCMRKYERTVKTVTTQLWDEEAGFYFDRDVKKDSLSKYKNADTFYYMYFEKDNSRIDKLMAHLNNVNEFNLLYIPMSSRDNEGFSEKAYWSGGHWPREMSYIAFALNQCGYKEKAIEILIRAICCTEGNILAEDINPIDGSFNTTVTKLAYCALNNLALLECCGKLKWSE